MTGRRQLALAVIGCALASAVVLFAASRTWAVEVSVRPAPLPPVSVARSGASLVPALPALALVALAAAGALLATRGRARTVVALVLALAGLGIAAVPATALDRPDLTVAWVAVAMAGGVAVGTVGVLTLRYGAAWPSLGARYDRSGAAAERSRAGSEDGSARVNSRDTRPDATATDEETAWWDAIDRGQDPTQS